MTDLLEMFKVVYGTDDLPSDKLIIFYLNVARDIICDRRNTDKIEDKYKTVAVQIAIELYSKRGAEGQVSHSENGFGRAYEKADVSPSLLSKITPIVKTPLTKVRSV